MHRLFLSCALVTTLALASGLALEACAPATVAEAEARHDVGWLDAHPNREAMEALGRLADHDRAAADALARRKGSIDVYHAAWLAHTRGAAWGDDVLRAALSSPVELPFAVAELPPRDPRLQGFADDLAKGIVGAGREHGAAAVMLLASLGPSSHARIANLLARPETRETTCAGLASEHVTSDARMLLTTAPPEARAATACRRTLLDHAASDARVLAWLGTKGEAPLFTEAASSLECPKLATTWEHVFGSSREDLVELEPSLAGSMARCATAMDPVIARALPSSRWARTAILHALAAEDAHAEQLVATCKQLPRLGHGLAVPEEVRALASSVHQTRCSKS